MSGKRAADSRRGVDTFSGSIDTFQPPRWKNALVARTFELGDLVTLAPEFRYSIANTSSGIDFGRYMGIIIEAYANREYMVVWTNHPLVISKFTRGMFNGDHLIKVENAHKVLMGIK